MNYFNLELINQKLNFNIINLWVSGFSTTLYRFITHYNY